MLKHFGFSKPSSGLQDDEKNVVKISIIVLAILFLPSWSPEEGYLKLKCFNIDFPF